jgi:hypothetical protein
MIADSRLFFSEGSLGSGFDGECRVGVLRAVCGRGGRDGLAITGWFWIVCSGPLGRTRPSMGVH